MVAVTAIVILHLQLLWAIVEKSWCNHNRNWSHNAVVEIAKIITLWPNYSCKPHFKLWSQQTSLPFGSSENQLNDFPANQMKQKHVEINIFQILVVTSIGLTLGSTLLSKLTLKIHVRHWIGVMLNPTSIQTRTRCMFDVREWIQVWNMLWKCGIFTIVHQRKSNAAIHKHINILVSK